MARCRGKRRQRKGARGKREVSNDVTLSRYDLSQLDEGYLESLPEEQLRSLVGGNDSAHSGAGGDLLGP